MLIRESLSRFDLLDDGFLAENVLNEKININQITNKAKKVGVLASLFIKMLLISGTTTPKDIPPKDTIAKEPIILKLAEDNYLTNDEIFTSFEDLLAKYMGQEKEEVKEERKIFSAAEPGFIDAINRIKPGRLDTANIARYDQYDDSILKAAENLKAKGEDADPNLIKAMMIIETGMNPVKNYLGYEGFPQTKEHIINGWKDDSTGVYHPGINQKYGTDFTLADMYDAEKAAEFMHYYMKQVSKSKYVQDVKDLVIAYNWGIGNLMAYKKGEKDLPEQSKDYAKMVDAMQNYFPTS